jgi:hypothetical protein
MPARWNPSNRSNRAWQRRTSARRAAFRFRPNEDSYPKSRIRPPPDGFEGCRRPRLFFAGVEACVLANETGPEFCADVTVRLMRKHRKWLGR